MRTLREVIQDARSQKVAVGHFNVSDSNQLNAIAATARELSLPVMIGVSEGERAWFGVRQVAVMVKSFRDAGQEIYLNADHTKTLDGIKLIGRDESWLLFRRSGTEPIVRVYAESPVASRVARLLDFGLRLIRAA